MTTLPRISSVAAVFLAAAAFLSAERSKTKIATPALSHLPPQSTYRDAPLTEPASEIANLPAVFEPNLGQSDPQVRFLGRASGMTSLLMDRENVMVLTRHKEAFHSSDPKKLTRVEQTVIRMQMEDAHIPSAYEGLEKAASISAYFIGNDPSKWLPEVPHYRKVRARGVYNGIDLVYYSSGRQLEYDFVVAPGADPGQIKLAYSGAEGLKTDSDGNLLIATPLGTVVQRKPKVYQAFGKEQREIKAAYTIRAGKVEFALASWDHSRALVIDPVLDYSTYLGADTDRVYGIAVDPTGAAYVTGQTSSTGLPGAQGTFAGGTDTFIAKLLPHDSGAPQLSYSMYLGGSGDETGFGIAVNPTGAAYITGSTTSFDFPTSHSALPAGNDQDVFAAKILPHSGGPVEVAWSGRLGGSNTSSYKDAGHGIAVDNEGTVYITGTAGAGFPLVNETQGVSGNGDAFVAKIGINSNGDAVLNYSTPVGGAGREDGSSIVVDFTGAAYVTGWTNSINFPTKSSLYAKPSGGSSTFDAIVFKVLPHALGSVQLGYSTYLGGTGSDQGVAIAIDPSGAVYVAGHTQSSDFPVTNAFQTTNGGGEDAFVVKFQPNTIGPEVAYSTYLGGSSSDTPLAISVDANGAASIAGVTSSTNFPTVSTGSCTASAGSQDLFVSRLKPHTGGAVPLDFSTLLGGDGPDWGTAIAGDANGSLYIAGYTSASDFPTVNPYVTASAGEDGLLLKLRVTGRSSDSIAAAGGSPQTTAVNTAFAEALRVRVTLGGQPVSGETITFTAPETGASSILAATSATTNCDGEASVTATANLVAGSYTVTASVAGLSSSIPFELTNHAGDVTQLRFLTQPQSGPAGPITSVSVKAEDLFSNPVAGANVTLDTQGGTGALQGNTTGTTLADGSVPFINLQLGTAGTYQLRAVAGAASVLSNTFQITPSLGVTIAIHSGNNQSVAVGSAYQPLAVIVRDSFGNPAPGVTVRMATDPNSAANFQMPPGAAFLDSVTDANGVATSFGLTANGTPGTFRPTAAVLGVPIVPVTFTLTNLADTSSVLSFVQQPSGVVAGAIVAPSVTVQVNDRFGNPATTAGVPVTLHLNSVSIATGTLGGTVTQSTDDNGVATFGDLTVNRAGPFALLAESPGFSSKLSGQFTVTAGLPVSIEVTGVTPQSATIRTSFSSPLQMTVKDALGNPVSGVSVNYTAPSSGASANLSSSTDVTNANGQSNVTAGANDTAGSYVVTGSIVGVAGTADYALTNVAGTTGSFAFGLQPVGTSAGTALNPLGVMLRDTGGNPIEGQAITISATGGPGTLQGTTSGQTDVNGNLIFTDLSILETGNYQLLATTGTQTAISANFQITPTLPGSISILSGDAQSAAIGTTFLPVTAEVRDTLGNLMPGALVAFSLPATPTSPGVVPIQGQSSFTVAADSTGIATLPGVTANTQMGPFQGNASIQGTGFSAPFQLTNLAGTAARLSFVQQPVDTVAGLPITPPIQVGLLDAAGNVLTTAGESITIAVPGVDGVGATVITDATGVASFPALALPQIGTYHLVASGTNLVSKQSTDFRITAGAPAAVSATSGAPQGAGILTTFPNQLQATVTDASGNPVSGVEVAFTVPASGTSAVLSGTTATTDTNGHARAIATANGISGTYSVTASVPSAPAVPAASFALTNVSIGPYQLTFAQQPQNTAAGSIMSPVSVQILDIGGNPVSGSTVNLSALGFPQGLQGTTTVNTGIDGLALFNDLSMTKAGSYQLYATIGGLSRYSDYFTITPAANFTVTLLDGDGQSAEVNTAYGLPLTVKLSDPFGNGVPGTVTFAAPSTGPSGTFSGVPTVIVDASGIGPSPPIIANAEIGSFEATATVAGVATPVVFHLENLKALSHRLTFVQQPTAVLTGQTMAPPVMVRVEDALGVVLPQEGIPITLEPVALLTVTPHTSAVTEKTAQNGVATFSNLSFAGAGSYRLKVNSPDAPTKLSNSFTVTANTPTGILATGGTPQTGTVQRAFTQPLMVRVIDATGNPVPRVPVKFTAPPSGPSGTFGAANTITTETDAQGKAQAAITANNTIGLFSVTATAEQVTGAAVFHLANIPLAPPGLVFSQQPTSTAAGELISPAVAVQIRDAEGKPVTTSGVPILLDLVGGTGTLAGSVVQLTDITGTATFQNLHVDSAGTKRLQARSPQNPPVNSIQFMISPGAPANLTIVGGAPQATTVLTEFPAPLRAKVTDVGGNPVPNATVTFTVPSSGASAAFAGPETGETGLDGIAISPTLIANDIPGSFAAAASTPGLPPSIAFALTNLPALSSVIVAAPNSLAFKSETGLGAPPNQAVQITSAGGSSVNWTATSTASWLSTTSNSGPTPGSLSIKADPTGLAPGTYTGTIRLTASDGSPALILVTHTVSAKPALVPASPQLVFLTTSNTVVPGAKTLAISSTSRAIPYNIRTEVSTPSNGTWLKVAQTQGGTPSEIAVAANPAGLTDGVYDGSVVLTPTEPGLTPLSVPVTLIVGCGQGGCQLQPRILSIVNSASFRPGGAPGAAMTIFGTALSSGIREAQSYPLPTQLESTTVTVNGVAAPLFYVSPTQINFQMPANAPLTGTTVVVNNGGLSGARALQGSASEPASLAAVDPALYVTPNGRAAARNADYSLHTALTPLPAGAYVLLFMNGQGAVTPAVADGTAASANPLSIINAPVQVTIGGKPAQVVFQGLTPGLAALGQINAIIPEGLSPGNQPVVITINGVSSNAGLITVR